MARSMPVGRRQHSREKRGAAATMASRRAIVQQARWRRSRCCQLCANRYAALRVKTSSKTALRSGYA